MANLPFSPIKQSENPFFVSGQIGAKDGKIVSEDIKGQTIQAFENIAGILKQQGLELRNIVDVTAFLTDQDDYDEFNKAYGSILTTPYPTRTTVTVKSLPMGAKVELKVVASK